MPGEVRGEGMSAASGGCDPEGFPFFWGVVGWAETLADEEMNMRTAMGLGLALWVAATAQGQILGSIDFPAGSAKHIKLVNPSAPSGIYWIDPDGAGGDPPFQIYADMTTDGGGWTLVLNSLSGAPAQTTDIVSNTGIVGLGTSHTRDGSAFAIDQNAQIRHTIIDGGLVFDAYYTGNYHDRLALSGGWTRLSDHNTDNLLSYHFGMYWTTPTNDRDTYSGGNGAVITGQPWYYGSLFSAIPTVNWGSYQNAPYGAGVPVDSYAIWVREGNTVVPEPSVAMLAFLALAGAGFVRLRRRG